MYYLTFIFEYFVIFSLIYIERKRKHFFFKHFLVIIIIIIVVVVVVILHVRKYESILNPIDPTPFET